MNFKNKQSSNASQLSMSYLMNGNQNSLVTKNSGKKLKIKISKTTTLNVDSPNIRFSPQEYGTTSDDKTLLNPTEEFPDCLPLTSFPEYLLQVDDKAQTQQKPKESKL